MNIQAFIDYSEGHMTKSSEKDFMQKLKDNKVFREEYDAFEQINKIMRSRFELDEVRSDSALSDADPIAKKTIDDFYKEDPGKYSDQELFIKSQFKISNPEKSIIEEIGQIKKEIQEFGIDEISEGWIKEWRVRNKNSESPDPELELIKSYINEAHELQTRPSHLKVVNPGAARLKNPRVLRIAGLAAAALMAGLLLFKTLAPEGNPGSVYEDYYAPFHAISPVVRDLDPGISAQYSDAVKMYKSGDYRDAASGFSEITESYPGYIPAVFFEGITQMELANYEHAIALLTRVKSNSEDFSKEAGWYLGLCYLKTGSLDNAIEIFSELSGSEGYYRDRSKKILRRLK